MLRGLARLLDQLLFRPDAPQRPDRLLGLIVLGLLAVGAWLIFWPFVPPLIASLAAGLIDFLTAPRPAAPPPTVPPSPSPLPSPAA